MKHKLSFRVEERDTKELPNEIAVKRWIIATSFNRRNLPLHVKLDLALEDEELEIEQARKRQACGQGGVLLSSPVNTANKVETGRALEKIAKRSECGHVTAFQYKKIKEEKLEKRVADCLAKYLAATQEEN